MKNKKCNDQNRDGDTISHNKPYFIRFTPETILYASNYLGCEPRQTRLGNYSERITPGSERTRPTISIVGSE
jgi:hypothetical protein